MSSGTPRLSRPGPPSFRRWLRTASPPPGTASGSASWPRPEPGCCWPWPAAVPPAPRRRAGHGGPPGLCQRRRMRLRRPQSGPSPARAPPGPGQAITGPAADPRGRSPAGPDSGGLFMLPRLVLAIRSWPAPPGSWWPTRAGSAGGAVPVLACRGRGGYLQRLRSLLGDPAAIRELLWLVINACAGWLVAVLPAGLIAAGLAGLLRALTHRLGRARSWGTRRWSSSRRAAG